MGACSSAPVVNGTPVRGQNDDAVTIEIKRVSGGIADRDNQWCLNNIIIIDANGSFVSHSEDALFHRWMKGSESWTVECPASARFIAFASQDIKSASLNVTSRSGSSASSISVPPEPVDTIHWSNGEFAYDWNADCNANERAWSYTVVPLLSSVKGPNQKTSWFSSWLCLKELRSAD